MKLRLPRFDPHTSSSFSRRPLKKPSTHRRAWVPNSLARHIKTTHTGRFYIFLISVRIDAVIKTMKKYLLGGLLFVVLEMFLFEVSIRLSEVWYSRVNRIEDYSNFCKVRDVVGNCLDFPWHTFIAWLGLFGVPLIVLVLFFVLLFKQKKSKNALCLVACYSIPMFIFHLGLIHIGRIEELWQRLEIANIFGMLLLATLVVVSSSTAGIFELYNRTRKKDLLKKT